jgi:hypothetical protein
MWISDSDSEVVTIKYIVDQNSPTANKEKAAGELPNGACDGKERRSDKSL